MPGRDDKILWSHRAVTRIGKDDAPLPLLGVPFEVEGRPQGLFTLQK